MEFFRSKLHRALYATDASIYRQEPAGVAFPRSEQELIEWVRYAREKGLSLIPRGAGTSLAGQCVGNGLVLDLSRHLNKILHLDPENRRARVQPGVVRDQLNATLQPFGLFFGPNTSTSNRCTIGGMVGNNSCGSTSIVYGTTRDHVHRIRAVLSDGQVAEFFPGAQPTPGRVLETQIYQNIQTILSSPQNQKIIRAAYPKPEIHRRNTGYALDVLLDQDPLNLAQLLCGSEGTLALWSEIELNLSPLPPPAELLVCVHFHSVGEALEAVTHAMRHTLYACELMDRIVLECTKGNIEQRRNRFFLEGDPTAILILEVRGQTPDQALSFAEALIRDLRKTGLGYAFPIVMPPKTKQVWALRQAGLGVLSNLPDGRQAITCVEDTAVALTDLPDYIREFDAMMAGYGQEVIHHAHAGAGELHLRPMLDLRKAEEVRLLRQICESSARLVAKYRGALSGEHGDGRVRSELLPLVLGADVMELLRKVKHIWDPTGLFNPGKITNPVKLDEMLRWKTDQPEPVFQTVFDFSDTGGLLGALSRCNGSGDCRKHTGTMCPSFQATRREEDSTRGRANVLRAILEGSLDPFRAPEVHQVLDLCLGCKGCSAECPSSVDMTAIKAEFSHHRPKSLRDWFFANYPLLAPYGRLAPAGLFKKILGIAPERNFPSTHQYSLRSWWRRQAPISGTKKTVYLFCDEFTNWVDVEIGIKAIQLLQGLGYGVEMPTHAPSGRTWLSKGFLLPARKMANKNVSLFARLVTDNEPLIGLEPSAILTFRDEYPRLVESDLRQPARELAKRVFLLEEFLAEEARAGHIQPSHFTDQPRLIHLHGHCHQKALSDISDAAFLLSLPAHWEVRLLQTGCCGMAGSFGYEKEHYQLSQTIGAISLFPALQEAPAHAVIAASGTSCRQQILDKTAKRPLHPAEILWEGLQKPQP